MKTKQDPCCRKETARCSVFFSDSQWLFDCYASGSERSSLL